MVFLALMLNSRCGWIGDCRQIYPRQFSRIFKQPNHIRSFFNAVISNIRSQVFRFKIISKSYFVLRVVPAHLSRPRLFPTRYATPKRDTQPTLVHPGVLLQQMVIYFSRLCRTILTFDASGSFKTYSHHVQATRNVSHLPRLLALQVPHNRNGSESQKVNWRFLNLANFLAAVPSPLTVL